MERQGLSLAIVPHRILTILLSLIAMLLTTYLASQTVKYVWGSDYQLGFARWVDLDEESNLPTWYSSTALFACAVLLALIAWGTRRRQGRHVTAWSGLSLLFCFLSLDDS